MLCVVAHHSREVQSGFRASEQEASVTSAVQVCFDRGLVFKDHLSQVDAKEEYIEGGRQFCISIYDLMYVYTYFMGLLHI